MTTALKGNRESGYDRADDDYYVEPSWVVDALLAVEPFNGMIYDPCCGRGTIPEACRRRGLITMASDIADRGYGDTGIDFFRSGSAPDAIISNPPYDRLEDFIWRALEMTRRQSGKVAVITRVGFLCGQKRQKLFATTPLSRIWFCSKRPSMPPGNSEAPASGGSVDYAWLVWDHQHSGAVTAGWLPINT